MAPVLANIISLALQKGREDLHSEHGVEVTVTVKEGAISLSESIPYPERNRNSATGTKMISPRLKAIEANFPFERHVLGAGAQSLTEPHSKTHSPKHRRILKQWTHFQLFLFIPLL